MLYITTLTSSSLRDTVKQLQLHCHILCIVCYDFFLCNHTVTLLIRILSKTRVTLQCRIKQLCNFHMSIICLHIAYCFTIFWGSAEDLILRWIFIFVAWHFAAVRLQRERWLQECFWCLFFIFKVHSCILIAIRNEVWKNFTLEFIDRRRSKSGEGLNILLCGCVCCRLVECLSVRGNLILHIFRSFRLSRCLCHF